MHSHLTNYILGQDFEVGLIKTHLFCAFMFTIPASVAETGFAALLGFVLFVQVSGIFSTQLCKRN